MELFPLPFKWQVFIREFLVHLFFPLSVPAAGCLYGKAYLEDHLFITLRYPFIVLWFHGLNLYLATFLKIYFEDEDVVTAELVFAWTCVFLSSFMIAAKYAYAQTGSGTTGFLFARLDANVLLQEILAAEKLTQVPMLGLCSCACVNGVCVCVCFSFPPQVNLNGMAVSFYAKDRDQVVSRMHPFFRHFDKKIDETFAQS